MERICISATFKDAEEYLESGESRTVPALLKNGEYVPDFSALDESK